MTDDSTYLTETDTPSSSPPPRPAVSVGTRAGSSWGDLYATLAPVFGPSGVTAIYRRALQSTETDYPWLREVRDQTRGAGHFAPLLARLSRGPPETARAVHEAIHEQFRRQLTTLLGEPLARRLLASAGRRADGIAAAPVVGPDEITEQLTLTALRAAAEARLARRERDRAFRASQQDDLTGAANRTCMLDRLNSAIALAFRTGTTAAVLFVDLDHFKQVNDRMGHRVGDEMLCEVASRLKNALRQTDTVCRYGGDEFVVILTPMERRSEAGPAARRILATISEVQGMDPAAPALSASIGIALYPDHGMDPLSLLGWADRSMYRHKCSGDSAVPAMQEDEPREHQPDTDREPDKTLRGTGDHPGLTRGEGDQQ